MAAERAKNDFSIQRILAVKAAREIGQKLVQELPIIADLYREGSYQKQIASAIKTITKSDLSVELLRSAVHFAILELIPDKKERIQIAKAHIQSQVMKALEEKTGIHAIPKKELKRQGKLRVKRKVGLFALTTTERQQRASEAIGSIIWEKAYFDKKTGLDLGDYCFKLANDPKCVHTTGGKMGKPNYELMATKLNKIFGPQLPKSVTANRIGYYLHYRKSKIQAAV